MSKLTIKFKSIGSRSYIYLVQGSDAALEQYATNVETESANDPSGKAVLIMDEESNQPLWFAPRFAKFVNDEGAEIECEVPPPANNSELVWKEGRETDEGAYLLGRYMILDTIEAITTRANNAMANVLKAGFKRVQRSGEATKANLDPATPAPAPAAKPVTRPVARNARK